MTEFIVYDKRTHKQTEESLKLYITDTGFSLFNDYGRPIIAAERVSETGIFEINAYDAQTESTEQKRFKVRL